jgi:ribulose-5-phosphate 4-epimerase/fuculose-1-phosphate aldolase
MSSVDEGYIKYRSERRDGTVAPSAVLDELNQARTRLFDKKLIGIYPDGVGFGNLSVRTHGNVFIVTASATGGLRTLTNKHYCLVEEFSTADNRVRSVGPLPASSEAMTHGAIYAANPAVQCVIHVHSRELFDHCLANGYLTTPAVIPYGTPAMAQSVSDLVAAHSKLPVLFAMAGHEEGIVAYGADVASTHALLINEMHRLTTP